MRKTSEQLGMILMYTEQFDDGSISVSKDHIIKLTVLSRVNRKKKFKLQVNDLLTGRLLDFDNPNHRAEIMSYIPEEILPLIDLPSETTPPDEQLPLFM